MKYTELSANEIKKALVKKEFSALEIQKEAFNTIDKEEGTINAFLTLCKETAMENAKRIDLKIKNGESLGKLGGIPIAIKDNICTDGIKTTCASKMLEDFIPPYNATVIQNILREDGIIVGKTNMDEFAMGSSTENSAFKITKNPQDIERVPGGSSGGSAAAVASKMVPISLGSDTGGSIRQPAAFCGVYGLKPTYGLVSRYGLIAFGSSLDQIGPFGRTTEDCALLMDIISGEDKMDSTSIKESTTGSFLKGIDSGIKGMKIGLPKEFLGSGLNPEIKDAVLKCSKLLQSLGAEVEEISLPFSSEGLPAYYIISSAEASSNLSRFDGIRYGHRPLEFKNVDELIQISRTEGFGREVKRRIMLGTYALSSGYYDAYYIRAQKLKKKIKMEFQTALSKYDMLISPVSPILPFKCGEKTQNPVEMYLSDIYTVNINLAGLPAISIPFASSSTGLPIGIQLIGPALGERKLFKAAYALEKEVK